MSLLKDRLKEARKAAALTQQRLGEKAGVPQSTIGALETGDHKSSGDIAVIAAALGVEALWLATGKGPQRTGGTSTFVEQGFSPMVLALAKKLARVPDEKLKAVSVLLGVKL